LASLRGEAKRGIGNPGSVIRMRVPVHVVVHVKICLGTIIVPKQLAESVRKDKSSHTFVDELVNGKRLSQAFQHVFFL
jgi:hypothetical protein